MEREKSAEATWKQYFQMQCFYVIYTFYLHYFTFLTITFKTYNNIDSKTFKGNVYIFLTNVLFFVGNFFQKISGASVYSGPKSKLYRFNLIYDFVHTHSSVTLDHNTVKPLWSWNALQTYHVYFTLKRRGNGLFHVISTWNICGVFLGYKDVLKTLPNMYDGNVCNNSYWLIAVSHFCKKTYEKTFRQKLNSL